MSKVYHIVQIPLFVFSKACSQCGHEKPIDEFYTEKRRIDGHKSICKLCCDTKYGHRKQPGIRRESRSKVVAPGNKWCNGCRSEQPIGNFTTDRDKPDGRATRCNTCRGANYAKFTQNCSEASREVIRAGCRKWQKQHPLQRLENTVRRRARERSARIGPVNFQHILERDGLWCYICEKDILPGQKIDFDHVIPLSRGGPHTEDNLKPTHHTCNRRKHHRLPEEMTPYQRRGV